MWSAIDPALLTLRSRLEHLERTRPSQSHIQQLSALATLADNAALLPEAVIQNAFDPAHVLVGQYTNIAGEIAVWTRSARVTIGEYCYLGPGSRIWSQDHVEIGNSVLIAHLVDIHDTDAHSLDWRLRRADPISLFRDGVPINWRAVRAASVHIEDDVWIGFKTSILKGVTIGRGAVIAAGSVVTKDVPPFTLAAGSPARVVRHLNSDELVP